MDVVLPVHQVVLPPVAHVLELAVQTGRYVQDVDLVLDQLDELEGLGKMHAVGMDLVGRDAVFDDEVLAAQLPDPVQHLDGEAGPVLERAAVLVGALVVEGAGELGDQVAVTAVDHAHLEAGPLAAVGGGGVLLDGLPDLGVVHLDGGERSPGPAASRARARGTE